MKKTQKERDAAAVATAKLFRGAGIDNAKIYTGAALATKLHSIKTTIRLQRELWRDARVRALDEGIDLQDLVSAALVAYLKTPMKREGSR